MNQLGQQYGQANAAYGEGFNNVQELRGRNLAAYNEQMGRLGPGSDSAQAVAGSKHGMEVASGLMDPSLQRLGVNWDAASGSFQNDANSNEMRARGLAGDFLTRAQAAAQGNAQVNPGLQRQLAEEEQVLRNQLQSSLGSDYATSTPGSNALADFSKRRTESLYNQQQQDMNAGVQNYGNLNQQGLNSLQALYGITDPTQRAAAQYYNQASNQAGQQGQTAQNYLNQGQNLANMQNQYAGNLLGQEGSITNQQMAQGQNNVAQGLGVIGAQGNNANLLSQQIGQRAQGMQGFQQGNMQGFTATPENLRSALGTAQNSRMQTLAGLMGTSTPVQQASQMRQYAANQGTTAANMASLFGSVQGGFGDTGLGALASIAGNVGQGATSMGLGAEGIRYGSLKDADASDMNNMFWRNMASSAGSSIGSMAGGAGGAAGSTGKKGSAQ